MGALQRPEGAADKAMAYREAGHIAAAFELGISIRPESISIVRSDEYRGRAHLILRLENLSSVILTDEMRLEAEKHAIMSLSLASRHKRNTALRRCGVTFPVSTTTTRLELWPIFSRRHMS
jgi:hypothetical protein